MGGAHVPKVQFLSACAVPFSI